MEAWVLTSLLVEDCCNGGGIGNCSSRWHGSSEAPASLGDGVEHCLLCLGIFLHHAQRRPCMHCRQFHCCLSMTSDVSITC